MSRSEKAILNETLVEVSAMPDTMIWRNNTGQAWQGESVRVVPGRTMIMEAGMVILRNARPINFGLEGSGDGLGVSQGVAVAIETKNYRGKQRQQQENFEKAFTAAGGVYIMGTDPIEIARKLRAKVLEKTLDL